MPPKSSEIPALFKADTATVSFDAAKSVKIIPRFSRLRAKVGSSGSGIYAHDCVACCVVDWRFQHLCW